MAKRFIVASASIPRRPSTEATLVRSYGAAGEKPPGISVFPSFLLSVDISPEVLNGNRGR